MTPPNKKSKRRSTSVPGQALGYFVQETKLTELLARAGEGAFVSLEVLDDVAVQEANGTTQLVQSKSALATNPVSDRSVPLWKTFGNWAEELPQDVDFSKLSLVIAVSNPRTGEYVKSFSDATTIDEAQAAIAAVELAFSKELASSDDSSSQALNHQLKRFFSADARFRTEIVRCFRLETSEISPQTDLPKFFPFIPVNLLEDVVTYALGWTKRQTDILLEKRKPAVLSRNDFHQEITSYIRKHRERAILRSFAPAEVPKDKAMELMPSLFVRQLEIVGADFSDRLQAISDYFRAAYDRTKWGESAEIHPSSFNDFEDQLQQSWRNLQQMCEIQHKTLPESDRGLLLYFQCRQHTERLEDQVVPGHFVPGSFHKLANEPRIGWHPRYGEVISTNAQATVQ